MSLNEFCGKTVEDALKNALEQLNTTIDKITYEVIDSGSKGLFNIIGTRQAKIVATKIDTTIDNIRNFLEGLLSNMKIEANIDIKEDDDKIFINLTGQRMGLIIGYRGETLDSIQYLVSLVANKDHEHSHKRIILDTENYRAKREETLKNLAMKSAGKVKRTKKSFKLEPMNPYERRIIHSALQNDKDVTTHSVGEEPYRRVVVDLK